MFENEESKQKRPGLADLKSREREYGHGVIYKEEMKTHIGANLGMVLLHYIYSFAFYKQLTTWADTSLHLLLL